jgi:hypothetical protein
MQKFKQNYKVEKLVAIVNFVIMDPQILKKIMFAKNLIKNK